MSPRRVLCGLLWRVWQMRGQRCSYAFTLRAFLRSIGVACHKLPRENMHADLVAVRDRRLSLR